MLESVIATVGADWKVPPKMHNRLATLEKAYSLVERWLPEYKSGGASVLDFSCGNGSLLEVLRYYGNTPMGTEVEYFLYMKSQNIPCIHHDSNNFPYPFDAQSYDLVSCIGAISFYGPPPAVLQEFFRVAKETVLIIVNTGEYLDEHSSYFARYCPLGWTHVINSGSVHKWVHE